MDTRDKINHAYEQRQYINHYISLSDTKMAIFVALNTVIIIEIIKKFNDIYGYQYIVLGIALVLLVMAIILSFSVLIPRTYNTDNESDMKKVQHIYKINNYKIDCCSILPIVVIETINLIKTIFFYKEKSNTIIKTEKQDSNFILSWVDMFKSSYVTFAIPEDMDEDELLQQINNLNYNLGKICSIKNALTKISIILSIYAYIILFIYKIIF